MREINYSSYKVTCNSQIKIVNFLTRNMQPTTHLSTQDHMTMEQIFYKSCVKTNENGTNQVDLLLVRDGKKDVSLPYHP